MYTSILQLYTQCKIALAAVPDQATVNKYIADLKAKEVDFPMFDKSTKDFLTLDKFGTALGYLSGTKGINT